jgi:hypothetical protein
MKANVDKLEGKSFNTKRGNSAKFIKLGSGGIHTVWKNKPTDEDLEECEIYVRSTLEENLNIQHYMGGKVSEDALGKAKANYEEWLKKQK